ncbi:Required for excision 1-B domain-containing protein [Arabidopsis thaliana x Arabidopsis arenosa]|uniref:Required for excision 1-B domain-containing protein n=1 Tax=Arabidopsis thaliana x Arabidopsis arenosa TaxID=1240361 RepID=A0A8T1YSS8_9BRAS|nr:Required for excision 1-B domain-containing protein [Arabidopsis thaliana x Arabidopsis arenosa]
MSAEDFQKKVSIRDSLAGEIEIEGGGSTSSTVGTGVASQTLVLLRSLLEIQQRRAQAYAKLKSGFSEYVESGAEPLYQTLCSEITTEFSECSKLVREMESQFLNPQVGRADLAQLLSDIQNQEKQKLHLTVTIQVLKKAGRPSERMLTHENCKFKKPMQHECVHLHEITEAAGTEEAEADAEFDNALKEAIRGVQDAVTSINEYLEDIRYEIEALEAH